MKDFQKNAQLRPLVLWFWYAQEFRALLKTNCCSLPVIHWLREWWEGFDDPWISYLLSQIQGCNLLVKAWLHPLKTNTNDALVRCIMHIYSICKSPHFDSKLQNNCTFRMTPTFRITIQRCFNALGCWEQVGVWNLYIFRLILNYENSSFHTIKQIEIEDFLIFRFFF